MIALSESRRSVSSVMPARKERSATFAPASDSAVRPLRSLSTEGSATGLPDRNSLRSPVMRPSTDTSATALPSMSSSASAGSFSSTEMSEILLRASFRRVSPFRFCSTEMSEIPLSSRYSEVRFSNSARSEMSVSSAFGSRSSVTARTSVIRISSVRLYAWRKAVSNAGSRKETVGTSVAFGAFVASDVSVLPAAVGSLTAGRSVSAGSTSFSLIKNRMMNTTAAISSSAAMGRMIQSARLPFFRSRALRPLFCTMAGFFFGRSPSGLPPFMECASSGQRDGSGAGSGLRDTGSAGGSSGAPQHAQKD